jgi:hypothetical protein
MMMLFYSKTIGLQAWTSYFKWIVYDGLVPNIDQYIGHCKLLQNIDFIVMIITKV